jgi:hypothetical protein
MLPDSFGKGDIGQGCVQCLRHWRSLLLSLYAQTIGESNSKTENIFDNALVSIKFSLIF